MPPENNEFNKFLEEVKGETPKTLEDALDITPEKVEEIPEIKDEGKDEPRKNRHHRRLEQQLAQEREARIEAETRAKTILEMNVGKSSDEVDPLLLQLYGSEERGKEAALLHQKLLETYSQKAREEALRQFEDNQASREREVKQFESFIDSQFEGLEDEYNADFTSNAPAARKARNEMLELLERISPKDDNGNITEYADMDGVYEMWKLKSEKGKEGVSDRQKELASRSTVKGDNAPTVAPEPTRGIWGWRKDFGL